MDVFECLLSQGRCEPDPQNHSIHEHAASPGNPGDTAKTLKIGIKHYFIEDESSRVITQVPQSIAYLNSLKEQESINKI